MKNIDKTDVYRVFVVVADLQERTWSKMNYLKHAIDKHVDSQEKKKKAVIIAHFPPESKMFGSRWDVVFLSK